MRLRTAVAVLTLSLSTPLQAEEIKPFVRGTLADIVTQYQNKAFIVSYWSVDCPPCYKELSMWSGLTNQYPDLPVVLVSTDGMEAKAVVRTTRHTLGVAHLPSWLFAESAERLRFEIDPQWYGELPRTYFYDSSGSRVGVSGLIKRQRVEQWMRKNDVD